MIELPEGSVYFWMYTQGLKHVPLSDIEDAARAAGRELRPKDIQNYWNGWYRSDLYQRDGDSVWTIKARREKSAGPLELKDYPFMPADYQHIMQDNRWVPCNRDNKPMIKWGSGCLSLVDAMAYPGQTYLAENNKGCARIIIDCDGDHGERLDLETILFLGRLIGETHCLYKDRMVTEYEGYEGIGIELPASFHLSFKVERIIPTMHFPKAGIDIIGNKENSLRYIKRKLYNGEPMRRMTAELWSEIIGYARRREAQDA